MRAQLLVVGGGLLLIWETCQGVWSVGDKGPSLNWGKESTPLEWVD